MIDKNNLNEKISTYINEYTENLINHICIDLKQEHKKNELLLKYVNNETKMKSSNIYETSNICKTSDIYKTSNTYEIFKNKILHKLKNKFPNDTDNILEKRLQKLWNNLSLKDKKKYLK